MDVDLALLLEPDEWTIAYAATYVHSPDARNAQFRIGTISHDEGIKVWLNKKLVLNKSITNSIGIDQDIIPVRLQSGRNEILLKVCNRTGRWGFYMRITDMAEQLYDDLRLFSLGR